MAGEPSPSPSPSKQLQPLSQRINVSTRSLHTQLNRLILLRLPLALPPHSANSSKYVSGLLHIAPIYMTFESLWKIVLRQSTSDLGGQEPLRQSSSTVSSLSRLWLPGLLRADRLRADIRYLTRKPDHKIDEELAVVARHGKLADFIAHAKESVGASPHVLVAYAWVFYMALFSGGRYLRASLKAANGLGREFWDRKTSLICPHANTRDVRAVQDSGNDPSEASALQLYEISRKLSSSSRSRGVALAFTPGLSFFDFDGDEDGEDIKREFKKRVGEVEQLLTHGEKDDIVTEAQHIFGFLLDLVGELDTIVGTNQ